MNILFIGNFQQGPGGEPADETHLTREIESQGHTVYRIARDEWREYVLESFPEGKYKVPDVRVDIAIICKWHHFFDGQFIDAIRVKYGCPVLYWVWDYMYEHTENDWHIKMARASDLYLSGELGLADHYRKLQVPFYYFQFDSCNKYDQSIYSLKKDYDVIYPGSCNNQNGRLDLLKAINKEIPIQIFGYDYEEWRRQGFTASPAVYGIDFNRVVSRSKIVLGTSAAGSRCYGYWSNRVGKVLYAGGFLLQHYAPGMETFIGDSCAYFSSPEEAIEKIRFYLSNPHEIEKIVEHNMVSGRAHWTSEYKIRQLLILIDRYLKDKNKTSWLLP